MSEATVVVIGNNFTEILPSIIARPLLGDLFVQNFSVLSDSVNLAEPCRGISAEFEVTSPRKLSCGLTSPIVSY